MSSFYVLPHALLLRIRNNKPFVGWLQGIPLFTRALPLRQLAPLVISLSSSGLPLSTPHTFAWQRNSIVRLFFLLSSSIFLLCTFLGFWLAVADTRKRNLGFHVEGMRHKDNTEPYTRRGHNRKPAGAL